MRSGKKLGRTLYIATGDPDHDVCIGIVDSPDIANFIIEAVNAHTAEWGPRGDR